MNKFKKQQGKVESPEALGVGVGAAIGVAFGVALGNIALGIGIGVAIGAGIITTQNKKKADTNSEE